MAELAVCLLSMHAPGGCPALSFLPLPPSVLKYLSNPLPFTPPPPLSLCRKITDVLFCGYPESVQLHPKYWSTTKSSYRPARCRHLSRGLLAADQRFAVNPPEPSIQQVSNAPRYQLALVIIFGTHHRLFLVPTLSPSARRASINRLRR